VVVANRRLSVTTLRRGPGTRTHTATLSRCTSKPATRSWICSIVAPSGWPTVIPPGRARSSDDSAVRAHSDNPGSRRSPRQTWLRVQSTNRFSATAPGRSRQHFISPGWPPRHIDLVVKRQFRRVSGRVRLPPVGSSFRLPEASRRGYSRCRVVVASAPHGRCVARRGRPTVLISGTG
jgi:hypothetical protein